MDDTTTQKLHHKTLLRPLIIILSLMLILISPVAAGRGTVAAASPDITSLSAILIDAKTGEILWEKNSRQKMPMASTTKMMTGILAIENGKADDLVTITPDIEDIGEAEIFLEAGESITVRDLLFATLVKSANDASTALAKHVFGSVESFVLEMNAKAAEIGAVDTNFVNPHGLNAPGHHSTAYDLGIIGRYCLQNDTFAKICLAPEYSIDWPGHDEKRVMVNHNQLLSRYPYAIGIKTGYTKNAGYCLVGAARKNDLTLISVILNAPDSETCYQESQQLLEYGFDNFVCYPLIGKGEPVRSINIPGSDHDALAVAKDDFFVLVPTQTKDELQTIVTLDKNLGAPLARGAKVGEIKATLGDKTLGQVDLVVNQSLKQSNLVGELLSFIQSVIHGLLA